MEKTLFVWDLNGTLETGSESADADALNAVFAELGIARRVTTEEMANAPVAWSKRLKMFAPDVIITNSLIERAVILREEMGVRHSVVFPGAIEALRKVKEQGDDNIVVSLLTTRCLDETVRKIGIKEYIDASYSTRDETFAKGPKRDYIDLLNKLARYKACLVDRHVRDRSYGRRIMVGDHEEDIEAGRLCGAITFFIGNGKADYAVKGPLDVVGIAYAKL
jgi:phosphoglycolate phosphatase-like HAD superfamily hydrolase